MKKITTVRVSLAFLQLAIGLFITFSENVVAMLTGNLNYTSPFPALPAVQEAIDALKASYLAAKDGGRVAIAARNQDWETLLGLMRPLAAWVQSHCQNNLAILLTSGFNATRSRTPVGNLLPPETPVLTQGSNTGVLAARAGLCTYGLSANCAHHFGAA